MRYSKWLAITTLIFVGAAQAEHMGQIGPTFEIQEQDMLAFIEAQVQRPDVQQKFQKMQAGIKEKVSKKTYRPKPVKLKKAVEPRQFTFDPSTSLPNDLADPNGHVFYKANTEHNPLEKNTLPAPLLFIDGDDEQQIEFAKQYEQVNQVQTDLTLTKGAPFQLADDLKRPVFFDQGGFITKHLGILQVPALVTQQGNHLLIEEIVL